MSMPMAQAMRDMAAWIRKDGGKVEMESTIAKMLEDGATAMDGHGMTSEERLVRYRCAFASALAVDCRAFHDDAKMVERIEGLAHAMLKAEREP